MKKIILLLAVMLMTAPAMAAVTITVTDDGGGWALIEYDATSEADFVRAFALNITADDANIIDIDSANASYWVYPGTIDINDAGGVNDVGSPIAPSDAPGALGGLDTNGVTIEMGALFEAGVDPEPAATGTLLRVQVDGACTVCVVGNSIRGNVVMKDASSIDPTEDCATIDVGPTCCAPDVDSDDDIDFSDYIAIQGNLAYADWLVSGGLGTHYLCEKDDPVTGFLYNVCMDTEPDDDVDFSDYIATQGILAYADWLVSGGAGTHYLAEKGDPVTGFLYPCP